MECVHLNGVGLMRLHFGSYLSGPNRPGFRLYPAGQGPCLLVVLPRMPWGNGFSTRVLFMEVR